MKYLIIMLLISCTQVTSLNLKRHNFGIQPTKIIWYQIAGLDEEHIALLRFKDPAEVKTSFEDTICMGNMWGYNFYQLKPKSFHSFFSQSTGSKNIKNDCSDFEKTPIWRYLDESGYLTGMFESHAMEGDSFLNYKNCNTSEFLKGLTIWKRGEKAMKSKTHLLTQKVPFGKNKVYYDRGCVENLCESSLTENISKILTEMKRKNDRFLFVIRDFSYLKALNENDFLRAKDILKDVEKSFRSSLELASRSDDYLVLLTTGESKFLDFPSQGVDWYDFEKSGKNISVKRSKLTNLVLASGSRAENFCGYFGDYEIFDRILSGPKQQGLEFKVINPFKI